MLYLNCPTCQSSRLAFVQLSFQENKKKICDNPNLPESEKDKEISKLIKSFGLRPCCNMRLLTYVNQSEIVKSPEELVTNVN